MIINQIDLQWHNSMMFLALDLVYKLISLGENNENEMKLVMLYDSVVKDLMENILTTRKDMKLSELIHKILESFRSLILAKNNNIFILDNN